MRTGVSPAVLGWWWVLLWTEPQEHHRQAVLGVDILGFPYQDRVHICVGRADCLGKVIPCFSKGSTRMRHLGIARSGEHHSYPSHLLGSGGTGLTRGLKCYALWWLLKAGSLSRNFTCGPPKGRPVRETLPPDHHHSGMYYAGTKADCRIPSLWSQTM